MSCKVIVLDKLHFDLQRMLAEHKKLIEQLRIVEIQYEDAYTNLQYAKNSLALHSKKISDLITQGLLGSSAEDYGISVKIDFTELSDDELFDGITIEEKTNG